MGLFDGTALERPVLCDRCGLDIKVCRCPPEDTPPNKQLLKVRTEKRSKGKSVTVISGFQCSANQMSELLTALQGQCGTGGTVHGETLELQGDQTTRVPKFLIGRGYRVQGFK